MQTLYFFDDVYNSQEVLPCTLPFIKKARNVNYRLNKL